MTDSIPRLDHRSPQGGPAGPGRGPGLLARLLGMVAGVLIVVAAFVFSAVLLAVLLVLGAVGLGFFWWKTRAMRRALREQQINPSGTGFPEASRPLREASDLRRPRRSDDVSDAQIIREESREDSGARR